MTPTPDSVAVTLADLDPGRSAALQQIFFAILRSTVGRAVFSQVIDGLPVYNTYEFMTTRRLDLDSRHEPTETSKELFARIIDSLAPIDHYRINAKVAQLYQSAPVSSYAANMHLLELVAVMVHDLAGTLFSNFHPNGEPMPHGTHIPSNRGISLSTRLYRATRNYSRGTADAVGYWAELNIFGGVVLFDRGPEDGSKLCRGAFIHPREGRRIFQLQDFQLHDFQRISSNAELVEQILPFSCCAEAKQFDPYEAFKSLNIYRDRYERQLPVVDGRTGCPGSRRLSNDPSLMSFLQQAKDMHEAKGNQGPSTPK
ncbi:hypothetical protein FQN54_004760 [Arachnomyces sp. PD_36]|nr:hypothetical protein FQN54_004760 [Arachnomyces sp. PD_36]